MKTTLDVLRKARRFVEAGWCQNVWREFTNGRISRCLTAALSDASHAEQGSILAIHRAYDDAVEILTEMIGGTETLPHWNDAKRRTKEEVLELLDRAIAELEGRSYKSVPMEPAGSVKVTYRHVGELGPVPYRVE